LVPAEQLVPAAQWSSEGEFLLELRRAEKSGVVIPTVRLPIDGALAVIMFESWREMAMRARYPRDKEQLYSYMEYHSCLIVGRRFGGWMSMTSGQGKLFSMVRAAHEARIWLRSNGTDHDAKTRFESDVRDLQRKLKETKQ
jgi:hypothetical protein